MRTVSIAGAIPEWCIWHVHATDGTEEMSTGHFSTRLSLRIDGAIWGHDQAWCHLWIYGLRRCNAFILLGNCTTRGVCPHDFPTAPVAQQ